MGRSLDHEVSIDDQPAMWNSPNITTYPRRPVAPVSTSCSMARNHAARCETIAPLDTPVEPLVRKMLLMSSDVPTRGGATVDAESCHPGAMTVTGSPSGSATARATSSTSGCTTTRRGVRVCNASSASASLKFGLIGASVPPALLIP